MVSLTFIGVACPAYALVCHGDSPAINRRAKMWGNFSRPLHDGRFGNLWDASRLVNAFASLPVHFQRVQCSEFYNSVRIWFENGDNENGVKGTALGRGLVSYISSDLTAFRKFWLTKNLVSGKCGEKPKAKVFKAAD
jgi:hypothetical protein